MLYRAKQILIQDDATPPCEGAWQAFMSLPLLRN